jgi:hypothetical protein
MEGIRNKLSALEREGASRRVGYESKRKRREGRGSKERRE